MNFESAGLDGPTLLSGTRAIVVVSGTTVAVFNPVTGALRAFTTSNNFPAFNPTVMPDGTVVIGLDG